MSTDEIFAWHWVRDKLRDGRDIPEDGVELLHDGEVSICETGLHASITVLDALRYAPGNTVCRVLCKDIVERHDDKFVCRSRTILWRVDAEPVLREFARKVASDVLHLWDAPQVVKDYLATGDESLRDAARVAADEAAWAAWDAEAGAARAAWAAADGAAWAGAAAGAAGAAADVAARAAARAARAVRAAAGAAQDAKRAEYNTLLAQMLEDTHVRRLYHVY
jgi:hypothetical protein